MSTSIEANAVQKYNIAGKWEVFLPRSSSPCRSGKDSAVVEIEHADSIVIRDGEMKIMFRQKGSVKVDGFVYCASHTYYNEKNKQPTDREFPTVTIKAACVEAIA